MYHDFWSLDMLSHIKIITTRNFRGFDILRVTTVAEDLDSCIDLIRKYRKNPEAVSIGFYGNIVDLWERLVEEHKKSVASG